VNEDALPIPLQVARQHVMDHPVAEVRGEDLAQLGALGNKADRGAGSIAAVGERRAQRQQVRLLLRLEVQGVDGVALVAPAA